MNSKSIPRLRDALEHLHRALQLLDRGRAPFHIVANVDLALNQLTLFIADSSDRAAPMPIGEGALRN